MSYLPIADIRNLANGVNMLARPRPTTVAFYIAFALWFTATRYSGPGFYSWLVAPIVQDALGVVTFGLFCVIAILAARRALKAACFPWTDAVALGGSFVAFDLFWRLWLSSQAWDAFKLTSGIVDATTPIIAGLGIAAIIGEWKQSQQWVA